MADWKSAGKAVASGGLRLLGGVLAGPSGAQVGGLLANALGLDPEDAGGLQAAIAADPALALKAREFELAHQRELEAMALEQQRVIIADIQNARAREVAVVQATGKRDLNQIVLGWVAVSGFFGLFYIGVTDTLSAEQLRVFDIGFGYAFGLVQGVYAYNFGTTANSARKTEMLARKSG